MAVPSSVIRVASQAGTWPRWSGRSAYPERFIAYDHTLPREKAHGAQAWRMRTSSGSPKAGAADPARTRGADNGDMAGACPERQGAPPRWARPPASDPDGVV